MDKTLIFLDGFMVPAGESLLETLAPGSLLGCGVFETMRVYKGKIFALPEHLSRLGRGLQTLHIENPYSNERIEKELSEVLSSNKLKEARLRLSVWKVEASLRISIIAQPYKRLPASVHEKGFKAIISNVRRDERSLFSKIKSTNYLPLLMARRDAEGKGCDEALLLNSRGCLVEGTRSNLFFVKEKKVFTPSLECGCLEGITRSSVIKLLGRLRKECKETIVFPKDLLEADEAFLTNSLWEAVPLIAVEGRSIGSGKIGDLTKLISKEYRKLL